MPDYNTMNSRGRFAVKSCRPTQKFTDGLAKALNDNGLLAVGASARMLRCCWRPTGLLPSSGMHHMSRVVMGIPRQGGDAGRVPIR